jgi:hypothetical protein
MKRACSLLGLAVGAIGTDGSELGETREELGLAGGAVGVRVESCSRLGAVGSRRAAGCPVLFKEGRTRDAVGALPVAWLSGALRIFY